VNKSEVYATTVEQLWPIHLDDSRNGFLTRCPVRSCEAHALRTSSRQLLMTCPSRSILSRSPPSVHSAADAALPSAPTGSARCASTHSGASTVGGTCLTGSSARAVASSPLLPLLPLLLRTAVIRPLASMRLCSSTSAHNEAANACS
jgi:hypothetical protein